MGWVKRQRRPRWSGAGRLAIMCLVAGCLLSGCAPRYSPYVYDETARLKKQSLALVDKAVEPYAKQEAKVEALKLDLSALVQQEQARKRNAAKVKQWQLLLNEQGHLLGGFLVKWQKDTVLNEVFVRLAESQIEQAFEVIQATEKDRR